MILELEPVTPFIVKSGNKFALLDLYEDQGGLFRIDMEKFIEDLKVEERDALTKLLEEFIALKKEANISRNSRIYEKYAEVWKKINSFNIKNGAEKYRILPKMSMNLNFKRYNEFDEFISIEIKRGEVKELLPYIPGSTIKGMIRRMLMLDYISRKKIQFFDLTQKSNDRQNMENAIKEVMPSIQISDFYPVGKVEIKMEDVRRSAPQVFPLIYSGKFYGEVNVSNMRNMESPLREFGIAGNKREMEENLLKIVLKYSNLIIRKNQEWYKDKIYFGPENSNDLIALGYGKGLTLSGFAAVKNDMKLILPDIQSKSRSGNGWAEQRFPKSNWTVKCYNEGKFMDTKLGILRVKKDNEHEYLNEFKEIAEIVKGAVQ